MSFWRNKKVVVTGGAGMMGSYLTEWLVKNNAKVTVADDFSGGRMENLELVVDDIQIERLDLRNYSNCEKICRGQDFVFNLAAKVTGIGYNVHHHHEMFEANMLLQQNVISAASKQNVKRFVQISTACAYPHDAIVPTPESEGARGTPEPTNEGYGWAKRMGERLAEYYTHETGLEAVIVRPFNIYGPRDYFDLEICHVIPALIRKITEGQDPVEIWGSGNQKRVFMHAKDTARGIQLLGEKAPPGEPINIGHEHMVSIKELFELICSILKMKPKAYFNLSKPEGYPLRAADSTKFRALTGFEPQISLEEGVREVVEWYQKNSVHFSSAK